MATLEKAIEIAASAHAGQVDKAGQPYILHPLRVMMNVEGNDAKICGVLHDVVEDTRVTLQALREHGFSEVVVEAIDALTKRRRETRMDAAHRAAANDLACRVKLADNLDNQDLSRLPNPTEKDFARMKEYEKVREVLLAAKRS